MNELAKMSDLPMPNAEIAEKLSKEFGYDQYISVRQKHPTSDGAESIPMGHFYITVGGEDIDLGAEVDVMMASWRPMALDVSDDANINRNYEPGSDDWKDIQKRADQDGFRSGCRYGTDVLLVIPGVLPDGQDAIANFYFAAPSTRAGGVAFMKQKPGAWMSIKSQKLYSKKTKSNYYALEVTTCPVAQEINIPIEEIKKKVEKFLNPDKHEEEPTPTPATKRAR